MKKSVAVISSPEFGVIRNVVIDGEPLFVAKDVCEVLDIKFYRDVVARLDDDEKGGSVIVDTPGGKQSMTTVNESGLYHLIFQSRIRTAIWLYPFPVHEALPEHPQAWVLYDSRGCHECEELKTPA